MSQVPSHIPKLSKSKLLEKKKKIQREKNIEIQEKEALTVPRSIIYCKGKVGYSIEDLMDSWRETMLPYTAKNITIKKDGRKSIIEFAQNMAVSHLIEFTQSEKGSTMRICKVPHGPTIYFSVDKYCSIKALEQFNRKNDLLRSKIDHNHCAVAILNNFNSTNAPHVKLAAATLQNIFPAVDVKRFVTKNARRVVLFNYNNIDETIDMRQYRIKMDDNEKAKDISLVELGPRMTLSVLKIVEACFEGDTIYHKFIEKTPEEVQALKLRKQKAETEKARRRQEQEENVERKKKEKEEKERKEREKIEKIRKVGQEKMEKNIEKELEEEDDEKYYKQEVGEAPPVEYELNKKGKQADYYTEAKKDEKKRKRDESESKKKKK